MRGGGFPARAARGLSLLLYSPGSHGEHIKCSPARAELAIDLICLPPGGGAPAHLNLGWVLAQWQSLRFCPPWL